MFYVLCGIIGLLPVKTFISCIKYDVAAMGVGKILHSDLLLEVGFSSFASCQIQLYFLGTAPGQGYVWQGF